VPISYGVEPFCVGAQRMTPIAATLRGEARVPDGVLEWVVIEAAGQPYRDPAAEAAAALSIQ
jgi:hypothetical protein